jgi:hypothetical protein
LSKDSHLARQARCQINLRTNGKVVITRGKMTMTSAPLTPAAAIAWLRHESSRFIEEKARAKVAKAPMLR